MREKFVGILGGMGPDATVTMFQNILRATNAASDQEHLRLLIYNNPKIPDRTTAICQHGESPLPALIESARVLERGGVDFLAIPCVTAHYFHTELQAALNIPVLHLVKEILHHIAAHHPDRRAIGVLATRGTLQSGLFQRVADECGIRLLQPSERMLEDSVMKAIYDIKAGILSGNPTELLQAAAEQLIQAGAQGIIAGCTEIPLALAQEHVTVPYFDALHILARAVVREARRKM